MKKWIPIIFYFVFVVVVSLGVWQSCGQMRTRTVEDYNKNSYSSVPEFVKTLESGNIVSGQLLVTIGEKFEPNQLTPPEFKVQLISPESHIELKVSDEKLLPLLNSMQKAELGKSDVMKTRSASQGLDFEIPVRLNMSSVKSMSDLVLKVSAAPAPNKSLGEYKVLVIKLRNTFAPDLQPDEKIVAALAGKENYSARNVIQQNSYNQMNLTATIKGPYPFGPTCQTSEFFSPVEAVRAVLEEDPNFDIHSYQALMILIPEVNGDPSCTRTSWGTIGSTNIPTSKGMWRAAITWSYTYFDPYTGAYVYTHELGHNLGMGHSNFQRCSSYDYSAADCTSIEYEDRLDVMGASWMSRSGFGAAHREEAGWMSGREMIVTQDGVYRLYPLERMQSGKIQLLKFQYPVLPNNSIGTGKGGWMTLDLRTDTNIFSGGLLNAVHFKVWSPNSKTYAPVDLQNRRAVIKNVGDTFTDVVLGKIFQLDQIHSDGSVSVRVSSTNSVLPQGLILSAFGEDSQDCRFVTFNIANLSQSNMAIHAFSTQNYEGFYGFQTLPNGSGASVKLMVRDPQVPVNLLIQDTSQQGFKIHQYFLPPRQCQLGARQMANLHVQSINCESVRVKVNASGFNAGERIYFQTTNELNGDTQFCDSDVVSGQAECVFNQISSRYPFYVYASGPYGEATITEWVSPRDCGVEHIPKLNVQFVKPASMDKRLPPVDCQQLNSKFRLENSYAGEIIKVQVRDAQYNELGVCEGLPDAQGDFYCQLNNMDLSKRLVLEARHAGVKAVGFSAVKSAVGCQ